MNVFEDALTIFGAGIAGGVYLYIGAGLAALLTLGEAMPRWRRVPLRIATLFAWPAVLVLALLWASVKGLLE